MLMLFLLWWTGALGAIFGILGEVLGAFVGVLPTLMMWLFGVSVVVSGWSALSAWAKASRKPAPLPERPAPNWQQISAALDEQARNQEWEDQIEEDLAREEEARWNAY
jgi:hypothetical protein